HRCLENDEVGRDVFLHLFFCVIASLDKSLRDLMPTLPKKSLRAVHEGEVQLALGPSGIVEVCVDDKYFHLVLRLAGRSDVAPAMLRPPFPGGSAFPQLKRPKERVGILVTQ